MARHPGDDAQVFAYPLHRLVDQLNAIVQRRQRPKVGKVLAWAEQARRQVQQAFVHQSLANERAVELVACFQVQFVDLAPRQIAQLARYDIENAREFGPITLPLKIRWIGYKPGDCLAVEAGELGLDGQRVLVTNRGLDPAGKTMDGQTSFLLITGAEPAALDIERELSRLQEKRDAGAEIVMTQPVFDPEQLLRFLERVRPMGLKVMVGILPLASWKNAEFLHQHVPGMRIPDDVRARMKAAGEGAGAAREGVAIAAEALREIRKAAGDQVTGVYIMPPFSRVELALGVLDQL